MPTYDYRCSACGATREVFQKMSDDPLTSCPECGGEFKRIITSVGVIFKGSGFHINDYRSKSSPSAPSKDRPADKDKPAEKDKPADQESKGEKTEPAPSEPQKPASQGKAVA